MKAIATLELTIDISGAKDMGLEIDDPTEYATSEFIEWVYEMIKHNDLEECINIKLEGKENDM